MKKKAIFLALTLLLIVAGFFVFHDDGRPDDLPRRYRIEALRGRNGVTISVPSSINNLGEVVGSSANNGYFWKSFESVVSLGSVHPAFITDRGQIDGVIPQSRTGNITAVRYRLTSDGLIQSATLPNFFAKGADLEGNTIGETSSIGCAIWTASGELVDLAAGVEPIVQLSAINSEGLASGIFHRALPKLGFWKRGSGFSEVETEDIRPEFVRDINSQGSLVGQTHTGPRKFSFLWRAGGGVTRIGPSTRTGEPPFIAMAINDSDQVVGFVAGGWAKGEFRLKMITELGGSYPALKNVLAQFWPSTDAIPHLWEEGQLYDLNWFLPTNSEFDRLLRATDINNRGQIIGVGEIDGEKVGFLMTPEEESRED
ncbi:MAG: hypothetical protein KC944_02920 [Candidatus Omnitrophica bacterium]|nr:hypothetical protein [Candidatus Omnitrophota bacterium]